MRVLVLGGSGAVGRETITSLRAQGVEAVSGGRNAARTDIVVDLQGPDLIGLTSAAQHVDVVVNASGQEDPRVAASVASAGAAFVEISATAAYLQQLERRDWSAPVVLGVGLAPGITNVLARDVAARSVGPIDIGIVLGAGDAHGPAATAWSYSLFGQSFVDPAGGGRVRNYTSPRSMLLPGGRVRRLLRADFADQHTLTRELDRPVRSFFGTDDRFSTALLAVLTWVPGARGLPAVHLPGGDRWVVLAESGSGERAWAVGNGQSRATGLAAATAAIRSVGLAAGVHGVQAVLAVEDVDGWDGITVGRD
ncbi:saccharopine dehydrogenase [Plantibacter sp. Mn2098]|uniref:saccharopine dehydrogenase n=1 Tax=Plantibacter sp. Mn2098 TaxID=3395266 RepID=UPI003BE2D163